MNKKYSFSELQEKISASQKILLALPPHPSFDQVAATLALFLPLQAIGKTVFVTCPTPMTVGFNHLVGVDKISERIQGTDLIVSFDYPADQIEKVSYNDENGRPNLVVQVKNGAPRLSESEAQFSYGGVSVDLMIVCGLKEVDSLFAGNDYPTQNIINIDIDPTNSGFGQVNVIDAEASSLSEVVLGIISGLGLPLDVDTAQNILNGIWARTRSLNSSRVGADTYESVAVCLRVGAQKPEEIVEQEKPEIFATKPKPELPTREKSEQPRPQSKPPADWFEPKIFKGASNA